MSINISSNMVEEKDDCDPQCTICSKIQIGSLEEDAANLVTEIELLGIHDDAEKKVALFRTLDLEGKKIFAKAKGTRSSNIDEIIEEMRSIVNMENGERTKLLFLMITKLNQKVGEPLPEFWKRLSDLTCRFTFEEKVLILQRLAVTRNHII